MKILYIAMKYDYGDPERGFGFEHYNFYDSLVKMDDGRHEIVYFPFDEVTMRVEGNEMNKQLLETVYKEKPDLCFFFLFNDEIKKETIKEITEKSGSITFNWFSDDHWRFDNFSKYWAPLFHWVATTDSQAPAKYKAIGYKNVVKTQWACNHFLYKPAGSRPIYRFDVSFVGQPHSNRRAVAEKIKRVGINIKCFGRGWLTGSVSQEEMIKIFFESKINLNLTKASGGFNFRNFARIFISKKNDDLKFNLPTRWFDNFRSFLGRQREQIKGRNFEILGCRGFMISGYADNLGDYYKIGKEIICYKNISDLIDKIKYYLSHEEKRKEIAEAGYKRTIQEHTYEQRFREIFKIIGLNN